MPIAHKVFLYWLLYVTVVVFMGGVLTLLGMPQVIISHDHSYLSVVLIVMYFAAEILSGYQAVFVSKLHRTVSEALLWLKSHPIDGLVPNGEGVTLKSGEAEFNVPPSPFATHLLALMAKSENGKDGVDQHFLIEGFAENLYRRTSVGDFLATRIVWVGILATILGVIIAFWPFLQAGLNIDAMKTNIGGFFSGVAVAFLPTAVSFVFKIALDFNSRIIGNGVSEIVETATIACESYVIPFLEHDGAAKTPKRRGAK